MQLPEGERSILSFFPSSTRASGASKEIIQAGLVTDSGAISVDRVSSYGVSYNHELNSPINNARTISGLTLYGSDSGGPNPLLAATDSASGMASDGAGMAGGEAFMLTVVTAGENVDQAVAIIKKYGGRV
ncbi:MAG: hypothetical protein ACM3PE_07715 [Deltaproteobacteria bacterium]